MAVTAWLMKEVAFKQGRIVRRCLELPLSVGQLKNGAPSRIRTRDPLITNQVLYQLSYKGMGF